MLSAARGCQGLGGLWAAAIIGSPLLEKPDPNKPGKTWELQQLHTRFLPSATVTSWLVLLLLPPGCLSQFSQVAQAMFP